MTNWIISPEKLPQQNEEIVIGAYNGTIFLLGGYMASRQLTTYEIATNTLTDLGSNLTHHTVSGYGQGWSQIDHIIYMIDQNNHQFKIYDMITNQYTSNWKSITFIETVGDTGCLASDSEYLYITGGKFIKNDTIHGIVQILRISTHQWMSNVNKMNHKRGAHACIVHKEYLWQFGGHSPGTPDEIQLSSIERISTINITQNIWNFTDPFSKPLSSLRAAAFYDTIYVIAGWEDSIHLVNAYTGSVSVSLDSLPMLTEWTAPIIVDAVLYLFGGLGAGNPTDDWAYYPLPIIPTSTVITSPPKDATLSPLDVSTSSTLHVIPPTSTVITSSLQDKTLSPLDVSTSSTLLIQHVHTPLSSSSDSTVFASENPTDLSSNTVNSLNETPDETVLGDDGDDDVNNKKSGNVFVYIVVGLVILIIVTIIAILYVLNKFYQQKKLQQCIIAMKTEENSPNITIQRGEDDKSQIACDPRVVVDDNCLDDTEVMNSEENHNTKGEDVDIADDEFIVEGDDVDEMVTKGYEVMNSEENHNTKGDDVYIADDEFIVEGDDADEMVGTLTGETLS